MFGSEYAEYPEVLLRQMSNNLKIEARITPCIRPLVKLYLKFFGIPEIGLHIRAFHFKQAVRRLDFESVLDAGCGLGVYSFYIAQKYPSAKISACDYNSDNIKRCKRVMSQQRLNNVNFFQADLLRLYCSEKYDLIFSIDVLEHINNDKKVLKNLYNSLKEDGTLMLHVPQKRQRRHFKRFEDWSHEAHVREGYEERQLIKLLQQIGFKVKEVRHTLGWFGTLAWEMNEISLAFLPLAAITFPFLLFICLLDILKKNKDGICMLIVARK